MPDLISGLPIWLQALCAIALSVALAFWKTRPKTLDSSGPDTPILLDIKATIEAVQNELAAIRRETREIQEVQKGQGAVLAHIEKTNQECATEAQLIAKDLQNTSKSLSEWFRDIKDALNLLRR